jgi:pantoate--beta-alanine ligase
MSRSEIPVASSIASVRDFIAAARQSGKSIGLVPTMGALHEGHAELVRRCRSECSFVVVSIFVNPTQFGPKEDLAKYPRSPEADHELCQANGADVIFEPSPAEMYPTGGLATFVEVPGLSDVLEGASRPGHFRGVATVVAKLLNIVQPDVAAFGRKDYQQLCVIRRMVTDLDLPVRILPVPIVRDADGLAMSSRNRYLNAQERVAATVLSKSLHRAVAAARGGERSADRIRQILAETIESEHMAKLDYAEVADSETLTPLDQLPTTSGAVALIAARVGPARLIDNVVLPA